MSEYEHSVVVDAAPETVFDFVSSAQGASILTPPAFQSETQDQDGAHVTDGWTRVHPGEYLMEWGSDGERSYSGWLQIEEMGDDFVEITMHLSFPGRIEMSAETVERDLLAAMRSIKEQIERRPLISETLDL